MPSDQLVDQVVRSQPAQAALPARSSLIAALLHRFLPDRHDPRYPRPAWLIVLRGGALLWWLPAITYLGDVGANLVLLGLRGGLASLRNTQQLAHAALLDLLWARLGQQPWLIAPAVGVLAALIFAGHWAESDATRESRVLLLRAFHEQPTRAGRAIAVGWWAVRWLKAKLWSATLRGALGAAALLLGVALALLSGQLS